MGTQKLLQGDCLELMKDIPKGSVDLILCDLPYGTTQNKWDSVIDLSKLWLEYGRVLKDNGAIVLNSQGIFTAKLMLSNEKIFKYKLCWIKSKATNFLNVKIQPLRKHEDVCIFYKKPPVYNPQMSEGEAYNKGFRKNQNTGSYGDFDSVEVKSEGKRYPTDVIYYATAESEGAVLHPTQKPLALMEYLIKTYSTEGDLVLDNSMGSGTTGVACKNLNRNFIGMELEEEYFNIATKRIHDALE
jgi:DNA modification methylase